MISRTVTSGFQRTVKGTGADRPNVPVGERNSMAEQRAFSAVCEEKSSGALEKGVGNSGELQSHCQALQGVN